MTPRPKVIYLAGDRELHAPERTLGTSGELAAKLEVAARLPIAPPPGSRPAEVSPGTAQLLRLDRVTQGLDEAGVTGPYDLLFVLTKQEDPHHRHRDTVQLSGLLRRWCTARGFGYDDLVLTGSPNRLDGAGAELLTRLDGALAGASGPVVLVAGGGTAALQASMHFATFRGVRHREQLVVAQLEEVVEQADPEPGPAATRRRPIIDSEVRVVERFHGVVGRRTIVGQAEDLLDELDLPGAAQLLRATGGSDVIDAEQRQLAERILQGLNRSHPAGDMLDALAHAIDLAEIEWSRPGGSHLEAIWYASLASIDLLPDARISYAGLEDRIEIDDAAVSTFNEQAGPRNSVRDRFFALQSPARSLRSKVGPLLCGGPKTLRLPDREIDVAGLCGDAWRGDDHLPGTVWAAMVVAYKPLRNEGAHQLLTGTREEAERTLRTASAAFTYAAAVFDAVPDAYRLCPIDPERLEEVWAALTETGTGSGGSGTQYGWQLRRALAGGPEVLAECIADEDIPARRFAALSGADRRRVLDLIDGWREGPGRRAQELQEQLAPGELGGLGALGLSVAADRPGSNFRRLCRMLIPDLPDSNRLLADASMLRRSLAGSAPIG